MFCSVAARLWLRAVSAGVVSANGYNAGSDLSEPTNCSNSKFKWYYYIFVLKGIIFYAV
jgi:hypothetical protein